MTAGKLTLHMETYGTGPAGVVPEKEKPGRGGAPGFPKAHLPCATLSYWSDTSEMGTLNCVFKGNESIASRHVQNT